MGKPTSRQYWNYTENISLTPSQILSAWRLWPPLKLLRVKFGSQQNANLRFWAGLWRHTHTKQQPTNEEKLAEKRSQTESFQFEISSNKWRYLTGSKKAELQKYRFAANNIDFVTSRGLQLLTSLSTWNNTKREKRRVKKPRWAEMHATLSKSITGITATSAAFLQIWF